MIKLSLRLFLQFETSQLLKKFLRMFVPNIISIKSNTGLYQDIRCIVHWQNMTNKNQIAHNELIIFATRKR